MRSFLFLLSICLSATAYAGIYKWTDDSGTVHYSDRAGTGAEKVELPEPQVYKNEPTKPREQEESDLPPVVFQYDVITISQPNPEATIRNNQGLVVLAVTVEPALREGDQIIVLLDGKAIGEPQTSTSITLTGIERGSHNLAVKIIDKASQTLGESDSVTFHMHRPRVNMIKK